MTAERIDHEFVTVVPAELEEGVLYVSLEYDTTIHLCGCGCGNRVVLPLHPTAWQLTYDGQTVSLSPSVGNWGFPCRSHYWVDRGTIRWAPRWSDAQVRAGRERTLAERRAIFASTRTTAPGPSGRWERLRAAVRRIIRRS